MNTTFDLDKLVGILNASDVATEATYQSLPPALQRYVDTGDVSAWTAICIGEGMDLDTFSEIAELAVFATNAATELANLGKKAN